jgi:inner membrane protein
MFTLSGVQFFYPFLRNSCVIPANPNYRFPVGDLKSELIVTGVCGILAITMQPLFENGFWTSYNRAFGTIKHVHRENNNTASYTLCDYSYIDNNVTREGTALVIESQTNEITLFDKGQVTVLNAENHQIKVNYTKPRPSTIPKKYDYIQFYGLSLDSIQSLLQNSLVTGLIQSNYNVQYMDKAITYNTNFINLKNRYNFHIIAMTDTVTRRNQELAELLAVQEEEQRRYRRDMEAYSQYISELQAIDGALLSAALSNYERNRLQNELIRLRNQRKEPPRYEPSLRTQVRIDELRRAIDDRYLQFSGYLTIYQIVDPSLPEVRERYREIEDSYLAEIKQRKSVFQPIKY